MRKTTTLLLSLLAVGSFSLSAQTFTDDFSTAHDYLTGVTGTIWDGVKENGGILEVTEVAEIIDLNTTSEAGALTFTTVNSYFAGNNDNGAMLYKNVPANTDFDLKVEIFDGTFPSFGNGDTVDYLMCGPIVRVDDPDSVKFIALQAFDRSNWGAVYGFRNIPMDPEENWVSADAEENPVSIASHPWMRLTKVGATYTSYISVDGSTWLEYWTEDRPDMDGFPLQVGLYNSSYTATEGTIVFDNFSLTLPVTSVQSMSESNMNVYYQANSRSVIIESFDYSNEISDVRLINMTGQVSKISTEFSGNAISASNLNDGLYIVVVKTTNGAIYSKKVAIY